MRDIIRKILKESIKSDYVKTLLLDRKQHFRILNSTTNPNIVFLSSNGVLIAKLDKEINVIFIAQFFWEDFEDNRFTDDEVSEGFIMFFEEFFKVSNLKLEVASDYDVKQWSNEPMELVVPKVKGLRPAVRYLNNMHDGEFTIVKTGHRKHIENYFENNRPMFAYYPEEKTMVVDEVILWGALKDIFNLNDTQIQKTIINWVQEKFGIGEIKRVEPKPMWAFRQVMDLANDMHNDDN